MNSYITNKRGYVAILFFLLLFISIYAYDALSVRSEGEMKGYQSNQGVIFTTSYNIKYKYKENLQPRIDSLLREIDHSLSPFNPQSILSRVNNNIPVEVDTWFTRVFTTSQRIHAVTRGAFDPTVSPLINAWGFGFSKKESVTPQLINELMPLVGLQKVKLENRHIIKENPATTLNFSAIAKGYACDIVADFLRSLGIENYMVEIGGEIAARGVSHRGTPWMIGINTPNEQKNSVEDVVEITSGGLATSGNYRNFYYIDGKRIAHTIDPKTGYPVQHSLLSATVLAPTCMEADAYATAFMVIGYERSVQIVRNDPRLSALFILSKGENNYEIVKINMPDNSSIPKK